MHFRVPLLVFLALQIGACSFLTRQQAYEKMVERFEFRLSELAGVGAEDCGSYGWEDDGSAQIQCGNSAAEVGRAFRLYGRVPGLDSVLYKGIARNSGGEVFLIIGDSDVRGGGGWWAKPKVFAFLCAAHKGPMTLENVFDCIDRREI